MKASPSHACSFERAACTAHAQRMSTELCPYCRCAADWMGLRLLRAAFRFGLALLEVPRRTWGIGALRQSYSSRLGRLVPGPFEAVALIGFPPRWNGPGSYQRVSIPRCLAGGAFCVFGAPRFGQQLHFDGGGRLCLAVSLSGRSFFPYYSSVFSLLLFRPCGPMAICTGQVFLPPYSKLSVYGFEVLPSQPFIAALLTIASYYFARKRCHRRWFQARTDAFRSS
jgi:hypothetical protein